MGRPPTSRFWKLCRIYFRRFRIALWVLMLLLVSALAYLNQVGLPGFIKRPLLDNLHSHGLDLRFSRLRLRWYRGLVAENVRFEQADEPSSPTVTLDEVQVRLNHRALCRLRLQIDSLALRQGRVVWPIPETNQAPRLLTLANLQSDLRFLPNDEWALDNLTATFAGASLRLSGTLTNASAVPQWQLFRTQGPSPAGLWQDRLRKLADTLESIHFAAPPELALDVRGDARDLLSFTVRMKASAPHADTPWGAVTNAHATLGLYPPSTNRLSRAELTLGADEVRTPWGRAEAVRMTARLASTEGRINLANGDVSLSAVRVQTRWADLTNVQLTLHASSVPQTTNLLNATLALRADAASTPWGGATNLEFNAHWLHAITNAVPLAGEGELVCSGLEAGSGSASEVRLRVNAVTAPADRPRRATASWGGWARLEPYLLDWEAHLKDVRSSQLAAREVTGGGSWRAPHLLLTNLLARLELHQLAAHAALDVATGALTIGFSSDLEPHSVAPLVVPSSAHWLAPFTWDEAPKISGEVSLVLPPWTNRPSTWRADLAASLRLQGEVNLEHGLGYHDIRFSSARSRVLYSDGVWRLPDAVLTRPEGRLEAALESDQRTGAFSIQLRSSMDVRALRPALTPGAQTVLDLFTFTTPPLLEAEARGRWDDLTALGARAHVSLTNFTFREQSISGVQTDASYTNRVAQFISPRVQRGAREARADGLCADFNSRLIFLTNAFTTVEPMVIAQVIGPHVVRAIEAYRFEQPPVARVHGIIPMEGEDAADLHFDLTGGPFDWWRFHVPEISGHVHWLGQHLRLSDIQMRFYGGQASGSAGFDFHPGGPADYRFGITTTNTDLQALMADLFSMSNHLRGALSGSLAITNGDTSGLQTWNGSGNLQLQDGLIWDIPIFGIFSEVLNGMVPGLGSSRATAGTCSFDITNGVIHSTDLEIRSTGLRLEYRGTVDFQGRVKARVEAGLLRNMWLVGPVVSTVFWPVTKVFEYKVSGTLSQPKAEPVFIIPKVMLLPFQMPFHPFRTLKGLLPEDLGASRTNSAPLNPPKP
ncbi:MAG TPA: AsmA-like C-terminal region-containing protein [Candidatus Acidoferrum sp.]|nr:AsmA-like C-terminal region-containing protein [Candidatus Acidoferrum sp.]